MDQLGKLRDVAFVASNEEYEPAVACAHFLQVLLKSLKPRKLLDPSGDQTCARRKLRSDQFLANCRFRRIL